MARSLTAKNVHGKIFKVPVSITVHQYDQYRHVERRIQVWLDTPRSNVKPKNQILVLRQDDYRHIIGLTRNFVAPGMHSTRLFTSGQLLMVCGGKIFLMVRVMIYYPTARVVPYWQTLLLRPLQVNSQSRIITIDYTDVVTVIPKVRQTAHSFFGASGGIRLGDNELFAPSGWTLLAR